MTHDKELLRQLASIPRLHKPLPPLVLELQNQTASEPQNQVVPELSKQSRLQIFQDGGVDFDGVIDDKNSELLERALQTAEYYKQQALQLEQEKIKKQQQRLDVVYISFLGSIALTVFFLSYAFFSTVRGNQLLREQQIKQLQPQTSQQSITQEIV